MGFSIEWEKTYQTGAQNSVWPWTEVVSLANRYFRDDNSKLRVLELGCGAGANIPFFAAIDADYCEIEGSATQVAKLQERFKKDNVTVLQGDFTVSLPFEGKFDLIVDRGSVTHNTTADIRKTIALAYERLREGGYYFALDWFSTNFDVFSNPSEVFDVIDKNTRVFHSGYFDDLGNVHFSDGPHIQQLFHQMTLLELYEKTSAYSIPEGKKIAQWSFVARK